MSRNLGDTFCKFCGEPVVMVEEPRAITRKEAGVYFDVRDGYSYCNMQCANAECPVCKAKYLAWVSLKNCLGYTRHHYGDQVNERGFFDLSFRSTFNDEEGAEDRPDVIVQWERVAHTSPWPRCIGCKAKMRKNWDDEWKCDECRYAHQRAKHAASTEWKASG